ncbi:MAG TPA: hypothetical protein VFI11_00850 [Anaerolineales bacterium]|nr:hypothetical protein [Anaerolineales bacterium]
MSRVLRLRNVGALILALILSAAVYGFAAANVVPDTYAGDGNGAILGYTVSNVVYTLDGNGDPSDIDEVSFTLDAAASEAFVSFDGGTTWTTCVPAGMNVTCSGLSQSVLAAANLRIVAAD